MALVSPGIAIPCPTSCTPAQVSFDPNSRVAQPGDQIMLSWRTPWGSEGHRRLCPYVHSGVRKGGCGADGDDGSQTWPGVGEEPPLVVVTKALDVRFVSASATPGVEGEKSGARVKAPRAWGFRFTAKGRKVRARDRTTLLTRRYFVRFAISFSWVG